MRDAGRAVRDDRERDDGLREREVLNRFDEGERKEGKWGEMENPGGLRFYFSSYIRTFQPLDQSPEMNAQDSSSHHSGAKLYFNPSQWRHSWVV
ncbi:hypothetical protein MRB53_032445 [Persea americana]|uniref:Uncharacterized protein n=1 Tax=Persea americana TaxID=3435 RepID=A0ACC2KSC7_PERAE|nr:hypothetical protein MRB53_032445 [Persea americana]